MRAAAAAARRRPRAAATPLPRCKGRSPHIRRPTVAPQTIAGTCQMVGSGGITACKQLARQRAMDRKASGGAARCGARLTVSIDPKLTTASKLGVQLLLEELGAHLIEDDKNTRSARSSRNTCTHGRTGRGQLVQDIAISHACAVRSAGQQLGLRQPVQDCAWSWAEAPFRSSHQQSRQATHSDQAAGGAMGRRPRVGAP